MVRIGRVDLFCLFLLFVLFLYTSNRVIGLNAVSQLSGSLFLNYSELSMDNYEKEDSITENENKEIPSL